MSNAKFITEGTAKRIVKDIKDVKKNYDELANNGIYYKHSEEELLKGYALLIGPKDTPYSYGYYFFTFTFPDDYPFKPPTVKFQTNDGVTRFNPNLYENGKVCLSLLNTWKGETWTSCQNIRSILLTLITILNENPLENEPGYTKFHKDNENYNLIVLYKNLKFSFYEQLIKKSFNNEFEIFYDIMISNYKKNKEHLLEIINKYKLIYSEKKIIKTQIYSLTCEIDFLLLSEIFHNLKI